MSRRKNATGYPQFFGWKRPCLIVKQRILERTSDWISVCDSILNTIQENWASIRSNKRIISCRDEVVYTFIFIGRVCCIYTFRGRHLTEWQQQQHEMSYMHDRVQRSLKKPVFLQCCLGPYVDRLIKSPLAIISKSTATKERRYNKSTAHHLFSAPSNSFPVICRGRLLI